MKLFLLELKDQWRIWDNTIEMLIFANNEKEARILADKNAVYSPGCKLKKRNCRRPWIMPYYTTCKEVKIGSEPKVIMNNEWWG